MSIFVNLLNITLSPISDTTIEPIDYVRIFKCFSPDSLQYAT